MIVVDTNTIGYLFLTSERSPLADRALKRDGEWVAPVIWRSEFRNVLALYMRKEIITLVQACDIMDAALALMTGREYEVASLDVLRIASESRCSAYDCEFVATASDLKVPLVTSDRQLLQRFPEVAVSLDHFVA